MIRFISLLLGCAFVAATPAAGGAQTPSSAGASGPGARVLLDAHNAYPEDGRFSDRISRALGTGLPLAIEQDLVWYRDPATGVSRSIVSHGSPFTGREPSLDDYFFSTIRPLIERAVQNPDHTSWPVLILNLDFKTNEPEHLRAVWDLLGRYQSWLCTAERTANVHDVAALTNGPLLVLTGSNDEQERIFHDHVALGDRLRLFGAVHANGLSAERRTNYRRWWNNAWNVIEGAGQPDAGAWTAAEDARLNTMVRTAHDQDLWIRFYTLDGYAAAEATRGWSAGYNFGSLEGVRQRWSAAIRAGVDFVATDQYEQFKQFQASLPGTHSPASSPLVLNGTLTHDDYETLLERSFDVPAGTDRIDIALVYDERERTVIDLGLRGPTGFRGWSGGGPQRVGIATYSASFGYSPGPIEAGRWNVILGVPNIRPGVAADYVVRVSMTSQAPSPTLGDHPGWFAGDLHTHSGHSDGRTVGTDGIRHGVPPEHVFAAAAAAGLDFVALTDHNTTSHWADVDRLQPLFPKLLLLHAREVTTYKGHVNAFGEQRFVDFRLGPDRSVAQLIAELNGGGTVLSINHPLLPDDESCMGCGWRDRSNAVMAGVQAIEIVNGERVDGAQAGWQFWADMLNRGYRLVAVGGSDEHTPDETLDSRIGRPTTVVYADSLAEPALLQGLRAGRVYVRTRGPGGPILDFSATVAGRHYEMGGMVPPTDGQIRLDAVVDRAEHQTIEWIRNGADIGRTTVVDGRVAELDTEAAPGDWFSAIVRDDQGPTVFGNAIYIAR